MSPDSMKANHIAAEQIRFWLQWEMSPAWMILSLGCVPFRPTLRTAHSTVREYVLTLDTTAAPS